MKNFHTFHMVQPSPWPLMASLGALLLTSSLTQWMHSKNPFPLYLSLILMALVSYQWWRDVIREATFLGCHTKTVINGLRWGMILFIISEIFFFLAFFWAFFHSSLVPSIEIGALWPPYGVHPFNPLQIPLLNTTILISSGVTVTWAHHSLMANNKSKALIALSMTSLLGLYFSALQALEYYDAPFNISDSIYGSTFFMSTGFHGFHVLIGTTFLITCTARLYSNHFTPTHHFGFEAAAWYWHFVDVVWLFLYSVVYWWGY